MPKLLGFNQTVAKELIALAKKGDMKAFEHIYRTYAAASFSLSYRICGQKAMAEDSVHDAFIKIMKKIGQFKYEGSFAGWCRRIVTFETINRVKQANRLSLVGAEVPENRAHQNLFDQDWLSNHIDLEKLVQQVTPLSRAVFFLHEVEGYSHKEIGQFFGKSTSFSKVTLSRTYTKLRQLAVPSKQGRHDAS